MSVNVESKKWGQPFNSNRAASINDKYNDLLHSGDIFGSNSLDLFSLTNIFMEELCGQYKFETKDRDLLKLQNIFWWNLVFYGRVGLWKYKDNIVVVKIDSSVESFNKIVECRISPTKILINFDSVSQDKTPESVRNVILKGKELDNIVIINNNLSNQFFYIKYGWILDGIQNIYEKYISGLQMKVKKISVEYNSNNTEVIDAFENSMKNNKTYIKLKSPSIIGDMSSDPKIALEKIFKIEQLKFGEKDFIGLHEVIAYFKFAKDIIGMDENISDTKERVIETEIESATLNTLKMEEVQMRNFEIASYEIKEKFAIEIKIVKTKDTIEPIIKNSEQAFNGKGDKNE